MAVNGGNIQFGIDYKVNKASLNDIKASIQELQKLTPTDLLGFNNYTGGHNKQIQDATNDLVKLQATANQVEQAFQQAFNPTTGLANLQKLNTSLKAIGMDNISKAFSTAGDVGNKAFYQITKGALATNMQLRQTDTLLDKIGTTFGNTLKWGISSSIMNKFVGSVQQAYGYIQHLDTSLNDIRIVTGKSADEMDRFAEKANTAAKALGASTTEYTEASLIYYQQGLDDEEAQARAETTLKAANVTGQSAREVSEQLTAVWNGYRVTAEQTESYVDKLAAVAATTASNLEELSTGMSKVASAANNMGVDVDQLNAQLATIISVTRQAPETAGTALKTIYARLEDLKISGEDEYGVKLGDVSSTLDELGIHVMDAEGNLRDLGGVIEEVAAKWDTWTKAQQSAAAQAMAGKRQYNNLLALFDNWDMYTSALETSRNSIGTLQRQQDTYMESVAAHIQQLKTQWEDFYSSLIDTDDINSILDILTKLLDAFTNFLDAIGGGKNALLMLGSTAVTVFDRQISAGITHIIQSFARMRNNTAELQAQLENIQLFKQTEQYQNYEPVRVLVDSLEQISQYYDVLNNEQINQANAIAQQVADAKELEVQWNKNTEALQKFQENLDQTEYKGIATKQFDVSNISDIEERAKALKDASLDFSSLSDNAERLEKDFEKLTPEVKNYGEALKDIQETTGNVQDVFNKLKNLGLFDNLDTTQLQEFERALQRMQAAAQKGDKLGFTVAVKDFQDILTEVNPEIEEFIKDLMLVNTEANKVDFSSASKSLTDFLQQAQLQNTINNLVNGFGALGQFASGLTSLAHSFDTLGDSSLSTSQKILQFTSSVGMGISMVISSLTRLPTLINGLSAIPTAINLIDLAFKSWTGTINKTEIAEEILDKLNDEAIVNLYKRAGVQKTLTEALTEEDAALIVNTSVKEGNLIATNALRKSNIGLAQKLSELITGFATAHPWILAVTAALTALSIAATSAAKAQAKAAERAKENAQEQYKAAQEQAETAEVEYNNVQKLIDGYRELKEQYDSTQIETLKKRIYELSQEYDVHIDMIQLMGANYEELDAIMDQLLKDISGEKTKADLESLNAHLEAIISEMKSIQLEDSHPLLDLFKNITSILSTILLQINSLAEKITGIETPDWVKNLLRLSGGDLFGAITQATHQANLNSINDPDVKAVLKYNELKNTVELDEEKFATYTLEQQQAVADWLSANYGEQSDLVTSIVNFWDRAPEKIEKAIRDTLETRQSYASEASMAEKQAASNIYTQEYGANGISSISQYNTAKKTISSGLQTQQGLTPEQADDLAIETLKTDSSYKIAGGVAILNTLKETGDYTEQELSQITSQLDNLSDAQVDFVSRNIDLFNALKHDGKDVNEIFNNLNYDLNNVAKQDHVITIDTILNGKKNSKDYKEAVDKLFSDESFNLGVSREDFELLEEADQKYMLIMAKRSEIEDIKSKNAEDKQTILERGQALEKEIEYYEELIEKKKEEKELATEQQIEGAKASTFDSGLASDMYGFEKGSEELEAFKESYINAMDDFSEAYKQATADGKEGFDAVTEAMENCKDVQIADYIKNYANELSLATDREKSTVDILEEMAEGWGDTEVNLDSYDEAIDEYNEKIGSLKYQQEELTEVTINWKAQLVEAQNAIEEQNKSIDNLQKSYQAMQAISEDYNDDQKLTLDNLQALVELPTEYAAALDIEGGQMSINNALMQQQLDLEIQKQKNLVTEAYLAELDAIANNALTNATKEEIEAELNQQAAINGVSAAAEQGYQALMKYAKAKHAAAFSADSAAAEQATKAYYNKMQMIDNVATQPVADVLGKADKSSSSTKEPKEEKKLEREADIYREINAQLKQIESTLKRIQKENSYKWGKDLQEGLKRENKLLDKQLDKLKEKSRIQQKDLAQRRANLEAQGISFSKDGSSMKNAEAKLDELYAKYNSMVDQYNNMSAEQQEEYKKQLEAEKKNIDKVENDLKNYESLFNEYQSVLDQLQELHYQQIENAVERFNNMVDVHLELDDAKKEWADFWYEVVQDVDESDFGGKIAQSMAKLQTLVGLNGKANKSEIAELTNHLNDTIDEVTKQIASRKRGGEDSLFEDATKLSKENLEKYRDALMKAVREAKEEVDNIAENYTKILESAKDLIDEQVDGLEAISDHLEHNIELFKIIEGAKAYGPVIREYEKLYQNDLKLLNTQKQSKDFWAEQIQRYEALLKVTEEGTVQWKTYSENLKKASENYQKAVQDLDKTLQETLKHLDELRTTQTDEIFDRLDKSLSNGRGLDTVEEEWKLINDLSSRYLDNVERALETELYTNDLEKAANAIGLSAENQAKLNSFMDDELTKLKAKNKLTQYDIDESRARLAILQAEIALEEQRNNKSKMRLRRDSQGNYNYQYVGDEQAIEEAENGVLTAKKEWYELVKKRYKEVHDYNIELRKQYSEYLKQANEADKNNEHEKAEYLRQLANEVYKELEQNNAEIGKNTQDLISGTAQFFADVENASVLPTSSTVAAELINDIEKVGKAGEQAVRDLEQVQNEYVNNTQEAIRAAGVEYEQLVEDGIDPTTESLEKLVDTQEDLSDKLDDVNDQLDTQEDNLRKCEDAYRDLKDAAVDAIAAANEALEKLSKTAIETQQKVAASVAAAQAAANAAANASNSSGTSGGSQGANGGTTSSVVGQYKVVRTGFGTKAVVRVTDPSNYIEAVPMKYSDLGPDKKKELYEKYGISSYKTGGFTGNWMGEGKLAVLHQKELVLNESDTSNILNAVKSIREIVGNGINSPKFDGIADALIAASAAQANALSQIAQSTLSALASTINNNNSEVQNYRNMTVNADFSGVRSADAIYQALRELENYGMQQSYSVAPHSNTSY